MLALSYQLQDWDEMVTSPGPPDQQQPEDWVWAMLWNFTHVSANLGPALEEHM